MRSPSAARQKCRVYLFPPQADEYFLKNESPVNDAPLVLVKWYAYAKWVLERVESFPKSQRFILGQRLSGHVIDVLETLGKASYANEKTALRIQANEVIEMTRWVVRMASDRKRLAPSNPSSARSSSTNAAGRSVAG